MRFVRGVLILLVILAVAVAVIVVATRYLIGGTE